MFKSLREKLKNWAEKISKAKESEKPPEEEAEEIEEAQKEAKKPEKAKPEKRHKEKKTEKGKKDIYEKIKETAEKISEETPSKFNAGTESFETDFERLKEKIPEKRESKPEKEHHGFFSRVSKVRISEKEFEVYKEELEMLLLENNVAFEVSDEIIKELKERVVNKDLLKKEVESEIKYTLGDIIREILIDPFKIIDKINKKEGVFVILFFGINGSGKTTTIAKIAEYLKENHITSVLAAGDTFRAASIEQLKKHGDKIGVRVISHEYGSDPAAVGFDAISYAKKNKAKCVLIDTAGRMHTEKNLIKEMEKVNRVCSPDLKIFVGESITGNDATEQAKTFNSQIGVDGIVLTKADIDEKGGTALSVGYVTKKPILFLGTGQEYSKIEPFDKNKFIEKLGLE